MFCRDRDRQLLFRKDCLSVQPVQVLSLFAVMPLYNVLTYEEYLPGYSLPQYCPLFRQTHCRTAMLFQSNNKKNQNVRDLRRYCPCFHRSSPCPVYALFWYTATTRGADNKMHCHTDAPFQTGVLSFRMYLQVPRY